MHILEPDKTPNSGESLANYVQRLRTSLGLSQKELATNADIHLQSLGKVERGQTAKLNRKTQNGLAYALGVPVEYLEAVCKGVSVDAPAALKFCPHCWTPGTIPESMWMDVRAKYCFVCGTQLRNRCASCNEPISSLKHRFCPYCGQAYKPTQSQPSII